MIQIDGNFEGRGGGQILRTALALSTLFQVPCKVINIRKGRDNPGLKSQHLFCIKALQQISNAKVDGDTLGSESILFIPNKLTGSKISIDIGTAGSVTLVLQSLLIPCIFSDKPTKIEITGGTDVQWAPQIDYLREIILPIFEKYTENIELNIEKRGYYPKGNGKITLKIKPKYTLETIKQSQKLNLVDQGTILQIKGISHASSDLQNAEVAERQSKSVKEALKSFNIPINLTNSYVKTESVGSGITLWAIFTNEKQEIGYKDQIRLGSDSLGERSKTAEQVGKEAALNLIEEISSKAAVDRHLADNIIPLLALVKGQIKTSKITDHTLTNIYAVEQFLGKTFKIENNLIQTI
jgi:RNA 3'-terminal phosphate cyclase (GTP)